MKTKSVKSPSTVNRAMAMAMAEQATRGEYTALRSLASDGAGRGTWSYFAARLLAWIDSGMTGKPPFAIFADGNSKLPFKAFSTLPVVNCPGAGACKSFCYSLTAWRYPAPYFRQLQNTVLCRTEAGRAILRAAFAALPAGKLRLYVDGDFSSVAEVVFWMQLIGSRPDILAYGYSKSWVELLAAHLRGIKWPANYLLNLSSGSIHEAGLRAAVAQLPITRGDFLAVPVAREHIKNRAYQGPTKPGWQAYRKAVQAAAPGRVFVCPGKCGACLADGAHACGAERVRGVTIAIGVH